MVSEVSMIAGSQAWLWNGSSELTFDPQVGGREKERMCKVPLGDTVNLVFLSPREGVGAKKSIMVLT